MSGIIQVIMLATPAWDGSALRAITIFWTTHMDPPTRTGSRIGNELSDGVDPRSKPRNRALRGMAASPPGSQEYSFDDRLTSPSGVSARAARIAMNSPKKMGI